MSRRAQQYELNERAKARARVTTPITGDNHVHSMGEIRASANSNSADNNRVRHMVLETIGRMQEQQRNELAYLEVMSVLEEQWKLMQVKRRFDQSH